MVKFVETEDVLPLRSAELRNHAGLEASRFAEDVFPETFHLAYLLNNEIACIATFFPKDHPGYSPAGYQLRGMATASPAKGKGLGSDLIRFAINYLEGKGVTYIWCNARENAAGFYKKLGFETISEKFEIPNIGPHYQMLRPLTKLK